MKTKLFIFFISVVLMSCSENDDSDHCVSVKVVKTLCGQAILEILDPAYFDRGQEWIDGSGEQYSNVFSTVFPCSFDGSDLTVGDEFQIQFTDRLISANNCVRCEALLVGPEKFNYVMDCLPYCGPE